jgi:hypothetical protein
MKDMRVYAEIKCEIIQRCSEYITPRYGNGVNIEFAV